MRTLPGVLFMWRSMLRKTFSRFCCSRVTGRRPNLRTRLSDTSSPIPNYEGEWGDYERWWSGMPITPFLQGRAFEPDQIAVMSAAFATHAKHLVFLKRVTR